MKISNETKVGALTIIALALLFIGFNYLKGKDVFSHSQKLYAVFTDLGTLEKSNEVKINGLPVGAVYQKQEKDKDVSAIVVTIHLTRDINIPRNSVAYISSSLIGSSFIVIERGNSKEMLQDGDTIQTRLETGILGDVKAQLDPAISSVRGILDSLKKTLGAINSTLDGPTRQHLRQTLANLDESSLSLKTLLSEGKGHLTNTLDHVEQISAKLDDNTGELTATLTNARKFTEKLASLELNATADSLNALIHELKNMAGSLNHGEGSAGAFLKERTLHDQLLQTILSAEILLDDLRTHPKRYVNVSLFGRKDKSGPLVLPMKKDSVSRNKQ